MDFSQVKISTFPSISSKKSNILESDISLRDYINDVRSGKYINEIIDVRNALQKYGKGIEYSDAKKNLPLTTACCTIKAGHTRGKNNISEMNGFYLADIDDDVDDQLFEELKNDKYTCIIHRSAGGKGACIFVKINPNKFSSFSFKFKFLIENE